MHQKRRRRRAASNSQQIVDDDDDGGATQLWRRKTNPGASPIPAGKGLPGLGFVLEKKPTIIHTGCPIILKMSGFWRKNA